jgi:hypothetical protein
MPAIILGGHFMDLSEKKAKRLALNRPRVL